MKVMVIARGLTVVLLAVFIAGIAPVRAQTDSFLVVKQGLARALDSLEMAKQVQKRSGLPIDSLEKRAAQLRDSIDALKLAAPVRLFGSAPVSGSKAVIHQPGMAQFKKLVDYFKGVSNTPFDMVIIIIGGIAILSGGMLVLGVIRILLRKRRVIVPSQPPAKTYAATAPPTLAPRRGDTAIRQIRDRIMHTSLDRSPPPKPYIPTMQTGDADVKAAIIAAARNGVPAGDLARQFHMSVDQVSLILTVAQKNGKS